MIRECVIHGDANAPDVTLLVIRTIEDLGSHVAQCATPLCQRFAFGEQSCNTEIYQPQWGVAAESFQHVILSFDVPVAKFMMMHVCTTSHHLPPIVQAHIHRNISAH